MTTFTIIGLVVVAIIGLILIIWPIGVAVAFSGWGGTESKWYEKLILVAICAAGIALEWWVLSHVHISVGVN